MSRFATALFALIACILLAASPAANAYWVEDGVAICTASANQQAPVAVSDGAGGAIIAWQDYYAGAWDIFAQRVSASGNALWAKDGIALCVAASEQSSPAIVSDGAGGAIVAWIDYRNGNYDIFAQRVNASGTPQWATNGVAICAATLNQNTLRICEDGAGGAIIAWKDYRNGNVDVYAQRVNAFGVVQWTANGVAISIASGNQDFAEITEDGMGGAVIAWRDSRNGNYDIFAQRVRADGVVLWTADGLAICTTTDDQGAPVICKNGVGGAVIAWSDQRGTYDNIYAQSVSPTGTVQWAANGTPVYAASINQRYTGIVYSGSNGVIVVWTEIASAIRAYAQLLNSSGVGQWSRLLIADDFWQATSPTVASDGQGGMIATWPDFVNTSPYYVRAQRVSMSGTLPWGAGKKVVCAGIGDQLRGTIAPDGSGGAVFAWDDNRNGDELDIYAELVDSEGRTGWLAPDIASVVDVPGDQGGKVNVAWDAARADRFMDAAMSYYSIWRSITATQAAAAIVEGGAKKLESLEALGRAPGSRAVRVEELGGLTYYWELIATHDAMYMDGYSRTVSTLWDSTAYCSDPTWFQVVAHTTNPQVFWKSTAASGRSVDNLPPGMPVGFEGERNVVPIGLNLTWEANTESDFSGYALYRGLSAGFVPGSGNLVAELDEAEYFDGEWNWGAGFYYKLAAVDVHGNESEFALFSPDDITGVETPKAPATTYLDQNYPNPFNPTTRIAFGLAAPTDVSLRIYDAAGRLVRVLVEGARPAGNYAEAWDGRDARGSSVSSGIYFYRLDAGAFSETKKMVLVR